VNWDQTNREGQKHPSIIVTPRPTQVNVDRQALRTTTRQRPNLTDLLYRRCRQMSAPRRREGFATLGEKNIHRPCPQPNP